jgi:small subunit ribosomal protein S4
MLRPKRFKIARRLGPAVFEQTQTERFAVSEARKKRAPQKDKRRKNLSAYNIALRAKQLVRIHYGLPERQFKRYVKESAAKTGNSAAHLYSMLEQRLDNIVYRIGLAKTHRGARQMVSHGHIMVNGKRIRVPSHLVSEGDIISVREGSVSSKLFAEKAESSRTAGWIVETEKATTWKVSGSPAQEDIPSAFNIPGVIEFYSR